MHKKERDEQFTLAIAGSMANIRSLCCIKVIEDQDQDMFDPAFDLHKFKVTKRQVADSLDSLPTSIRSTMVAYCQGFFNAIHEP